MRRPTFAMAGDQMIGILAAAGSRAWRDRRAVVDTADIVAVLARRRELRCGYRARRRLWTWPRRCEAAAHTPALAAIDHEASAALREALWIARRRRTMRCRRDRCGARARRDLRGRVPATAYWLGLRRR